LESDSRQAHWEGVYTAKGETEVSWFQDNLAPSLDLIGAVGATPETAIIDIGGGASRLVDSLLAKGFRALSVLDLSGAALDAAKSRLGAQAEKPTGLLRMRRCGSLPRFMTSGTTARPSIFSPRNATARPISLA
jgi:hypothetical protein